MSLILIIIVLLLLVFRPNLATSRPPLPAGEDWLSRLARGIGKLVMRLVRRPLRAEKVG